ncbi:MAG: hypothetical protein N2C12_11970 [Planctomycetales bacterium]
MASQDDLELFSVCRQQASADSALQQELAPPREVSWPATNRDAQQQRPGMGGTRIRQAPTIAIGKAEWNRFTLIARVKSIHGENG